MLFRSEWKGFFAIQSARFELSLESRANYIQPWRETYRHLIFPPTRVSVIPYFYRRCEENKEEEEVKEEEEASGQRNFATTRCGRVNAIRGDAEKSELRNREGTTFRHLSEDLNNSHS